MNRQLTVMGSRPRPLDAYACRLHADTAELRADEIIIRSDGDLVTRRRLRDEARAWRREAERFEHKARRMS
ncbi:MAG: hypothetical protein AAGA48_28690 [Myxococcota bacterium]